MKQYLFLSLYFITVFANAQDAIKYYKKINEAKKYAIETDFQLAVNSYHAAFQSFESPFARDCYNAIELSVVAKDTIKLDYFISKAILSGIELKDLEASEILNNYLRTGFYKKIKENSDSLRNIYLSKINWELRNEINNMFSEDQKLREEYYSTNILKRKKVGKEWEDLNTKQVERLVQITKTHGFPGERLIGLDRNEMHPKISTKNYSAGMPIVILIHHYSQPNPSYGKLFLEQVKIGNLYNEHFATICDFEAEFGKGKHENFGYFGLRHHPKKLDTNKLNMKRAKIGIIEYEKVRQLNRVKNISKFWNRLY